MVKTASIRFYKSIEEYTVLLGLATAMIWVWLDGHSYHEFEHFELFTLPKFLGGHHVTLHFFTNDFLMFFFFFLVIIEMRRNLLKGGELGTWQARISTSFATAGGVLPPYAIYWYLSRTYMPEISDGFVVPMATDIVFANLFARIIFGRGHHPAKVLLLALAILDDLVGTVLIPTVYGDGVDWIGFLPWFLVLMFGTGMLKGMGVRNKWWYIAISVPAIMVFLHFHVHPAIAAISFTWFIPHGKSGLPDYFPYSYVWNKEEDHEALEEIEHWLRRGIVPFVLFCFGLLNGGILLGAGSTATYIVVTSLIVGKGIGIPFGIWLGHMLGFKKPDGVEWAHTFIIGFCAGIGFTVAIFVANLAFEGSADILADAKLGALYSMASGFIAWGLGRLLGVKPMDRDVEQEIADEQARHEADLELTPAATS